MRPIETSYSCGCTRYADGGWERCQGQQGPCCAHRVWVADEANGLADGGERG